VPPVTSLTEFRYADDGTPEYVTLPADAEALIDRDPPAAPWLGQALAAPGQAAWLLDEAVIPAALRSHPAPVPSVPDLRRHTHVLARRDGIPAALAITASPDARPAAPAVPGYLTVYLDERRGRPWAGPHAVTPEDLILLLSDLHVAGQPVLLRTIRPASTHPLHDYSRRLQRLLQQTVKVTHQFSPGPADRGRDTPGPALAAGATVAATAMTAARDLPWLRQVGRLAGVVARRSRPWTPGGPQRGSPTPTPWPGSRRRTATRRSPGCSAPVSR
jgi:hypothetical protein